LFPVVIGGLAQYVTLELLPSLVVQFITTSEEVALQTLPEILGEVTSISTIKLSFRLFWLDVAL